jgi:hypothetical protein
VYEQYGYRHHLNLTRAEEAIRSLASELYAYLPDRDAYASAEGYAAVMVSNLHTSSPHDVVYDLHDVVSNRAQASARNLPSKEPSLPLPLAAQRLFTTAQRARIPYPASIFSFACLQAELSLEKSLTGHEQEEPAGNKASIILYGEDGHPLAFQKNDGMASAYVWRSGTIATANGPLHLPEKSFVRPIYLDTHEHFNENDPFFDNHKTPQRRHAADRIVAGTPADLVTVQFLRFSNELLPTVLRAYSVAEGANKRQELAPFAEDAMNVTSRNVGERVLGLLQAGLATQLAAA